ncbi:substrate-binding domain-containing protein [Oscillibacter sp.]|uniref:substrate-binding domain-containing protein n=1 Tax=Oscillibacter sp. TaxID=1945593 RepID=UPI002896B2B0|nr:substrate-binding domain-containing protein [Oscillibacter sp.]
MKKTITMFLAAALAAVSLAGCGGQTPSTSGGSTPATDNTEKSLGEITVVSREDGSGTRGAFIELFGIEVKGEDGTKKDMTTKEAVIANKTDVMMGNVAGDPAAIGYISLGSLNDTVKALTIDGAEASAENVKNGTYAIARPFNIATNGEATGLAKDFIDFILSAEGQQVVSGSYIAVDENAPAYAGTKPSGKISVAGSSSVTPVMEKLKEAYLAINSGAEIEIQMTDSTAGMTAAMEGVCDIGMASRELKPAEAEKLTAIPIALDGIAVVVNSENPLSNMTSAQVQSIFTGETTSWDNVK